MNIVALLAVSLALVAQPDTKNGPGKGEPKSEDGIGFPKHPILPYPPEVPKPSPAAIEEDDDDLASLVQDLEDYRVQFYRNELEIRYGAHMKQVRHVLGAPDVATFPPDGAGHVLWWYGDSFVVFRDRKVIAWEQNDVKLAFGLDVAPRHYLPRSAYRDKAAAAPGSILAPGGGAGLGLSPEERARTAYLLALAAIRRSPEDPTLRLRAQELGRAYYGLLRHGNGLTQSDEAQIQRDLDQAVGGGGVGP